MGSQLHHKLPCNVQHLLLESTEQFCLRLTSALLQGLLAASRPHRHSSEPCHFIRHSSGKTNLHTVVGFIPVLCYSPVESQAGTSNCPTPWCGPICHQRQPQLVGRLHQVVSILQCVHQAAEVPVLLSCCHPAECAQGAEGDEGASV